jgi:hypothetical protein
MPHTAARENDATGKFLRTSALAHLRQMLVDWSLGVEMNGGGGLEDWKPAGR